MPRPYRRGLQTKCSGRRIWLVLNPEFYRFFSHWLAFAGMHAMSGFRNAWGKHRRGFKGGLTLADNVFVYSIMKQPAYRVAKDSGRRCRASCTKCPFGGFRCQLSNGDMGHGNSFSQTLSARHCGHDRRSSRFGCDEPAWLIRQAVANTALPGNTVAMPEAGRASHYP